MSRFLPSLLTYSFIEPCGCSDHCETKFMGGFSLKHNISCEVCFGCTFILSFAALFAKMYIYTIKTKKRHVRSWHLWIYSRASMFILSLLQWFLNLCGSGLQGTPKKNPGGTECHFMKYWISSIPQKCFSNTRLKLVTHKNKPSCVLASQLSNKSNRCRSGDLSSLYQQQITGNGSAPLLDLHSKLITWCGVHSLVATDSREIR